MRDNRVSIVMPVYKSNANYLRESIDSIVKQTHDEWELLLIWDVCNNQTTGNSLLDFLRGHYKDDHRIRFLINSKRLGFVQSLNKGLQLSEGNIIR